MDKTKAYEINLDGLVAPTHNYSGLSYGNLASTQHQNRKSNPKEAALQGLRKMKALADLGIKQAVFPPQERPHVATLRRLGFEGTDEAVIEKAARTAPSIFRSCASASSMWTANSATFAPSTDSEDGLAHFTPANLSEKFHRSIEWEMTGRILQTIFYDETKFVHHAALPAGNYLGDEGAANHTRFCRAPGGEGLHFFVYGRAAFQPGPVPQKFPARQTREASEAVARLHHLPDTHCLFAQQNPVIIDAGVFHNDVAAVGNQNVLLAHETAYLEMPRVLEDLRKRFHTIAKTDLKVFLATEADLPVADAIRSYVFNTQVVTTPSGMVVVAPEEAKQVASAHRYLNSLVENPECPIEKILFFDLRQSMSNGGGPACLRFRVVLNESELLGTLPSVFLSDALYDKLTDWVERHYRDSLSAEDLADPKLLREGREALEELTRILGLGSLYDFQR
jgi:succinylarginine dihydrolase